MIHHLEVSVFLLLEIRRLTENLTLHKHAADREGGQFAKIMFCQQEKKGEKTPRPQPYE